MRKNPKSPKMCSQSAEIIGGNGDLLGLIFPRLPVISLTRFKSVSKQWLALISDRKFGRRHTLGNPSSCIPSGLFLHNPVVFFDSTIQSISLSEFGGKIPSLSDPIKLPHDVSIKSMQLRPDENVMLIVQSCNGLILCRFKPNGNQEKSYCVRNLVTNELKFVPFPKFDANNHEWIISFCLAFDPLVSAHFKVICVKGMKGIGSKILIFSSETGHWRDTNVTMDDDKLNYAIGEYCHGAIYWIKRGRRPSNLSCYRFDIEAEILTNISMPPTAYNSNFRHFGESCGHLYLVCVGDMRAKVFNVFELDQVKMKWFIKHWVHVDRLISSFPQVVVNWPWRNISILRVVGGEEEEDSALVVNISGKVISYNFKSKKVEVLLSELEWERPSSRRVQHVSFSPIFSAYPFIATLHPLQ